MLFQSGLREPQPPVSWYGALDYCDLYIELNFLRKAGDDTPFAWHEPDSRQLIIFKGNKNTMPNLTFKQFLGEYGIRMLFVATDDIQPGIVIQPQRKGFFKYDDLYKVFGQPADAWAHQFRQANMITGTVNRSLSLAGKASLDEFGVSIHGGLARSKRVTFKLKDIKARSLATRTRADIEQAIAALKKADKVKYKKYAHKFALDQTFYADSFEAEFDVDGNVDLRAELEGKIEVQGDAEIKWTSKRAFKIASNAAVPFGFAGVKM